FVALTLWASRKRFHGELLALYLILYAPLRAIIETMRGDEERGRVLNFIGPAARGAWWNLSTSELISIGIFAAGVLLYALLGRRAGGSGEPAAAEPRTRASCAERARVGTVAAWRAGRRPR